MDGSYSDEVVRVTLESIPENLRNILQIEGGIISRIPKVTEVSAKKREFLRVIEGVTREEFTEDHWTDESAAEQRDDELDGDESNDVCICSKHIHHLYYIQHISSGQVFKVGSECVRKISEILYKKLTKDKCKRCKEPVPDKRRKFHKDGYCGKACYLVDGFKITFGQHRGKKMSELPDKYVLFLHENRHKWNGGQIDLWEAFDASFEIK